MYLLSVQPYLDRKYYKNIITINTFPRGPLCKLVKRIYPTKLSPFTSNKQCCSDNCLFALCSICNPCELMCLDELPELLTYLENNHYEIDHNISKIILKSNIKLKILFFIKYIK